MPIYEYKCLDCANQFEELVLSAQQEVTLTCPGCRSNQVERIMSMFGFSSDSGSSVSSSSSSCSSCAGGHCSSCH